MSEDSANYAELARVLQQAAEVIDSYATVNIYCKDDTPAQFSFRIRKLADRVRREDRTALRELIPIFGPTGEWDDVLGFEDMDLPNRVCELLDLLRWND